MDSIIIKIIVSGILFIVIFISGIQLRKTGHPYNFLMISFHKFISLALIGILIWIFIQQKDKFVVSDLAFNFMILSGILFVLALISGGLLSAGNLSKKIFFLSHKITSVLILVSCCVAIFLMVN